MRESKKHTVGKKVNRAGLCVCLAGLIAVSAGVTSYAAVPSGNDNTLIRGDVNLDSMVNLKDAIQIQKFALGMIDFNDEQKKCADVDDNDNINLLDSIVVQKYAVGVETEVKGIGEAITDPVTDPTDPVTKPTEPATKPTEPPTKPTEPPTTPTEPTEPSEAVYEWVPIYEKRTRTICNGCGLDITNTNLDHIWDCGPNYHSEDVWLFYGTDEWVVKNKDVGNRTLVEMEDQYGKYYSSVGVLGSDKAIREADQMIVDLWFLQDDIYKLDTKVPIKICSTGVADAGMCYENFILRNDEEFEVHKKLHEAKGEKFEYRDETMEVLYKKVKVEK